MNAIILCGGLSTRLGEITKSIPKILLDIKGRPVLDWQLEKLKAVGINEVVLAAGHLSHILEQEVGSERSGMKLIYAIEKEKLGTGGAIKHAWGYVPFPEKPTIIFNGDILAAIDLKDMQQYLRSESEGIILGAKVEDASTYETLDYNENYNLQAFKKRTGIKTQGFINGGFYIFTPRAKKHFPEAVSFSVEYDVFPKMKDLDVYESDKPWIDIGVPERLEWARNNWSENL